MGICAYAQTAGRHNIAALHRNTSTSCFAHEKTSAAPEEPQHKMRSSGVSGSKDEWRSMRRSDRRRQFGPRRFRSVVNKRNSKRGNGSIDHAQNPVISVIALCLWREMTRAAAVGFHCRFNAAPVRACHATGRAAKCNGCEQDCDEDRRCEGSPAALHMANLARAIPASQPMRAIHPAIRDRLSPVAAAGQRCPAGRSGQ
jgi:hypothetical protein